MSAGVSVSAWVNGRRRTTIDYRDRGLQYGDGIFETMRVYRGRVRLLDYHLERLDAGCARLEIHGPPQAALRRELQRAASSHDEAILKLIVTRGPGPRGYRPTGRERCTRILSRQVLRNAAMAGESAPVRIRMCATPLGQNPRLAGLKTLNRLESVLARAEWRGERVWEGLMRDVDENIVCGTMSNVFLRSGALLVTPLLDRCGVAGVMRRWILEAASGLRLKTVEGRVRWQDLETAEEVFLSNAVVGVRSVAVIERGRDRLRLSAFETARELRSRLETL